MNVVTMTKFPWGVRCGACRQVIRFGELYRTAPEGMTGSGVPVEVVCCLDC